MTFNDFDIAFFLHTAEMFNHYSPVWNKLKQDSFIILVYGSEMERERIIKMCHEYGVHYTFVETVIDAGFMFDYLISNHAMHMFNDVALIKVLGKINIRFMYTLGAGRHNMSMWNENYDLFLCFGPYDSRLITDNFGIPVIQMGYPRYDSFYAGEIDITTVRRYLNLDLDKKTLLWLPTMKELSTIDTYGPLMSTLSDKYNVVVKLHPLSLEGEPERIEKLMAFNFSSIITDVVDNVLLYAIADKVICDYGGTVFGAIYLDKDILFINMDNAEEDALTGQSSPEILLREDIVNIDRNHFSEIYDLIEEDDIWISQKDIRKALRRKYFAPYYGFSSEVAALAIQNCGQLVNVI